MASNQSIAPMTSEAACVAMETPALADEKTLAPPEVTVKVTRRARSRHEEDAKDGEEHSSMLVAKSVRNFLKNLPTGCHCSAEALPALNAEVVRLLQTAAQRASDNGRKTLKACDF